MKHLFKSILFQLYNLKEQFFPRITDAELKVIRNSKLFANFRYDDSDLIKYISLIRYPADELILKEGELGNVLYFIVNGAVRVFTFSPSGMKIPLARLEKDQYFGEQILLSTSKRTRNASVEAITDVQLIKVDEKFVIKCLGIDKILETNLKKIGYEQMVKKLTETFEIYKDIRSYFETNIEEKIVEVPKGTTIFEAGDAPDYVYFIIDGKIKIEIPSDSTPFEIILQKGHILGELGVINNAPRRGKATTIEPSRLIRISSEEFKKVYSENSQLKQLLKSLKNSYVLSKHGEVNQFFGSFLGMQMITTIYSLSDGRIVTASHAVDKDFFVMESQTKTEGSVVYTYEDRSFNIIDLTVLNHQIVAIKCRGSWDDLPTACEAVLEKKIISDSSLENFKSSGELKLEISLKKSNLICDCMYVEESTVRKLISEGVRSLSQISEITSACTVCGSCRGRVLELLGQNIWLNAMMTKIKNHNNLVASYEIQPSYGHFNATVPGEHVVVQVKINDSWIERPYTISDLMVNGKLRITIKKEEGGFFTQWLFNTAKTQLPIYVSQPQGLFVLNLDSANPVLCIGGGIGITPFITFAKKLKQHDSLRKINILYVVRLKEEFLFLDEFESLTKEMPTISLTLWEKATQGRIQTTKLKEMIDNLGGNPDIYICGPEGFEISLQSSLKELEYPSEKIFIEKFTYANPILRKEEA